MESVTPRAAAPQETGGFPHSDGEMAACIREHDWSSTALGPIEEWPDSLKAIVELILPNDFAMIVLWTRDLIQIYNDGYRRIMANKHPSGLGQTNRECWPEVWHINEPIYERVWNGETVTFRDALYPLARRGMIEDVWITLSYSPVRETTGEMAGILVTLNEVTERVLAERQRSHAEATLRASESRLRHFGEASSDALWMRSAGALELTYVTPAFARMYGLEDGGSPLPGSIEAWQERILPEDRGRALAAIERTRTGEQQTLEYRITRRSDGEVRWIRSTLFPVSDGVDGQAANASTHVGGVDHDVTAIKEAQERQELLLFELQHRVRNTLSVVRSIARRTANSSRTIEELSTNLEGRIDTFARIQAAVTRDPDRPLSLESIIREELEAAAPSKMESAMINGPVVRLQAEPAESIALAFHELTTNAIKHGALTGDDGRVEITWTILSSASPATLEIRWEEYGTTGVPAAPGHRGFGTDLLERVIGYDLGAMTSLDYAPTGLKYRMAVPMASIVAQRQTGPWA